MQEQPEGILKRRTLKRNNEPIYQILIKWKDQEEEEASWEDYKVIKERFPQFTLEDKVNFEREAMSEDNQLRLGAIEEIDKVKQKKGDRREKGQCGLGSIAQTINMKSGSQSSGSNKEKGGQLKDLPMQVGSKEGSVNEIDGVKEMLNDKIEESS